jgi:pimeloyl-ACP methyl ester carboxylesterase
MAPAGRLEGATIAAFVPRLNPPISCREDVEARARRIASMTTGPAWLRDHPEDLDQIARNAVAKPMSPESIQRQLDAVRLPNGTADRLAQIKVPTLVIHGDHDALVPYGNGQYLAAHIDGARASTYVGVGHLPPIEATGPVQP